MRKVDVARAARDKWGTEMPSHQLARIIYKENSLLFKDVEDARSALRRIEGKAGKNATKITHKQGDRPLNPYKLPESYANLRDPYILPKGCNNILLISDLHIPYHNITAVTKAMQFGVKEKVNTIFINGDLIDFARISKFEADLNKRNVVAEFDAAKEFLRILRKTFPKAHIYWHKGNHDVRYEHFLMRKAPELFGDPYFELQNRLRLNEERIHLIDDKTITKAGNLTIVHGHHLFKGIFSPVSPARGAFLKAKQSVIVGHLHRPSYHPETDLDGNVIGCWSTGCLCELRTDYMPQAGNAMHGFAHIRVGKNGGYKVDNYSIIKGEIYHN